MPCFYMLAIKSTSLYNTVCKQYSHDSYKDKLFGEFQFAF